MSDNISEEPILYKPFNANAAAAEINEKASAGDTQLRLDAIAQKTDDAKTDAEARRGIGESGTL